MHLLSNYSYMNMYMYNGMLNEKSAKYSIRIMRSYNLYLMLNSAFIVH